MVSHTLQKTTNTDYVGKVEAVGLALLVRPASLVLLKREMSHAFIKVTMILQDIYKGTLYSYLQR